MMRDEDLDRELSALLDGELNATRARQLREEIEADPRLRERLAELESVDERLRALPRAPLPAQLGARLRERTRQREGHRHQEHQQHQEHQEHQEPEDQHGHTTGWPSASIVRWGVPLAAALAAGLGALWLIWPVSEPSESVGPNTVQRSDPDTVPDDSSDEEIAIALELATLRDLDLIQELDLLEALLAMETAKEGSG